MDTSPKASARVSLRGFTSVLSALSFLVLTFTGIFLFFLPPGWIANDPSFHLLGLTKVQWQTLHVSFGLLFLIIAFIHIVLNWRPLISYFKSRPMRLLRLRWEWVLPLVLVLLVAWGAAAGIAPFSSLMQYQHNVLPYDQARGAGGPAGSKGFGQRRGQADRVPTAATAPARSNTAAAGSGAEKHAQGQPAGRGYGRMTIQELAQSQGIDVKQALERLKAAGIEVSASETVRDVSGRSSRTPSEIATIVASK